MAAKRVTERNLVLPALYLMKLNGGSATTSQLIASLRDMLKPPPEDLELNAGRNDDKFSQKVRNLTSHGTFRRNGFATYERVGGDGVYTITGDGRRHLDRNKQVLAYLLVNDFTYDDITTKLSEVERNQERRIEVFDENTTIQEGLKRIAEKQIYERSSKLRQTAIDHFSVEGRISCHCCEFNSNDFYGKELANGYIEIHHQKPVFKYADEDLQKTMTDALSNLMPVCSNCHRIIHRDWSKPREIQQLITGIRANGLYRGKAMW